MIPFKPNQLRQNYSTQIHLLSPVWRIWHLFLRHLAFGLWTVWAVLALVHRPFGSAAYPVILVLPNHLSIRFSTLSCHLDTVIKSHAKHNNLFGYMLKSQAMIDLGKMKLRHRSNFIKSVIKLLSKMSEILNGSAKPTICLDGKYAAMIYPKLNHWI